MVINTDGSVNPSTRGATAGGLIRDYLGRCYLAFNSNLGSCSISRAELHGIATGLRLAWDAGFRSMHVQSDSRTALALVLAEGSPHHQHIFQEANQAADYLASIGYSRQLGTHLISTSDCNLGFFLRHDCMGISTPRLIPD
ncbi:Putative ribonuclease H protein At1g65750 [Linum perenne]